MFDGVNQGLVVAEVELEDETAEAASYRPAADQVFDLPPWAGEEVSSDPRYLNSSLCLHPFIQW